MPMRRRFVTGPLMLAVVSMSCGRDPAKESAPAPAPAVRDVVLAQSKAEWPELTIQVVEVSRDQSGLTVRFRFVNASAQPFPLGDRFAADSADHDSLAGVALVDPSAS